ncbi:MAG: NAD(P)H-hydrate dehydratase [Lachnospiraceae bacterium]|nr:NAD(P)H-hydrate dehydratase [Lachnospiraceae bacterium]
MIDFLSVENMCLSDAAAIRDRSGSRELMRCAGESIFGAALWKPPVAVVCGSGNNAGDGYVVAAALFKAGIDVSIILLSDRFSEDGAYYYAKCKKLGIKTVKYDENTDLGTYCTILDCIFGTGFKGKVSGAAKSAIEAINSSGAYVISADINSGLNGDSGMAEICVRSDLTVSIGGYKSGHFLNMAKDVCGRLVNADIGIRPVLPAYHLIEKEDIKQVFPPRKNFSNKSDYGYVALFGGSERYGGAIRLASMANAACLAGAGVTVICAPDILADTIKPGLIESTARFFPASGGCIDFDKALLDEIIGRVKTIAFGMGIGISPGVTKTLDYILENFAGTLIIDADGLRAYKEIAESGGIVSKARIILTPHNGEFCRLTGLAPGELLGDPIKHALGFAAGSGVTLLLKGPATIVTDGKEVYIVNRGCPGMATAGSGDVLSGILAAVTAYCPDPVLATCAGAFVNGLAGELAADKYGEYSMRSRDTVEMIAAALSRSD